MGASLSSLHEQSQYCRGTIDSWLLNINLKAWLHLQNRQLRPALPISVKELSTQLDRVVAYTASSAHVRKSQASSKDMLSKLKLPLDKITARITELDKHLKKNNIAKFWKDLNKQSSTWDTHSLTLKNITLSYEGDMGNQQSSHSDIPVCAAADAFWVKLSPNSDICEWSRFESAYRKDFPNAPEINILKPKFNVKGPATPFARVKYNEVVLEFGNEFPLMFYEQDQMKACAEIVQTRGTPSSGSGIKSKVSSFLGSDKDIWLAIGHRNLANVKKLAPKCQNDTMTLTKWTPLHYAVSIGDYEIVKELIAQKQDIDARDHFGATPLDLAIREDHLEIAQLLAPMIKNKPSFHHCCHSDEMRTARWCLEHSKGFESVNHQDSNGQAAIHVAAIFGNFQLVLLLIEQGCTIDLTNRHKRTALHLSVESDNNDVAQHLIEHKANVNAQDALGTTPLMVAASESSTEIIQTLLTHHADVTIQDKQGNNVFHVAAKREIVENGIIPALSQAANDQHKPASDQLINQKNNQGLTPMHMSVVTINESLKRQDAMVQYVATLPKDEQGCGIATTPVAQYSIHQLVHGGADPSIGDMKDGSTAAHMAAQLDCVSALSVIGDQVPAVLAQPNNEGQCPMHLVQSAPALNLLVNQAPSSLNSADKQGETPLSLAVQRKSVATDLIQSLLKAGANPVTTNNQDATPLFSSIRAHHPEIAQQLLCHIVKGKDQLFSDHAELTDLPDYLNNQICGPLKSVMHLAAELDLSSLLGVLIQHGGELEQGDANENTPLHYAAVVNSVSCTNVLAQAGANVNSQNIDGNTPLLVASANDKAYVVDALLQNVAVNLSARNNNNQSALMVARAAGADNVKQAINHKKMIAANANVSGKLTVGLSWSSYTDLCLCVVGPSGEMVWFGKMKTDSGGVLDVDQNIFGRPTMSEPVEHVYFDSPPKGKYSVFVLYFADNNFCLTDEQREVGCEDPCPFDINVELGQNCVASLTGQALGDAKVPEEFLQLPQSACDGGAQLNRSVEFIEYYMSTLRAMQNELKVPVEPIGSTRFPAVFVCSFSYDGNSVDGFKHGEGMQVDNFSELPEPGEFVASINQSGPQLQ